MTASQIWRDYTPPTPELETSAPSNTQALFPGTAGVPPAASAKREQEPRQTIQQRTRLERADARSAGEAPAVPVICLPSGDILSFQLLILPFGLLQNGDVRVCVFPEREEILIGFAGLRRVVAQGCGACQAQLRERV